MDAEIADPLELLRLNNVAQNGDGPRDSIGPEDSESPLPFLEPGESPWRMVAQTLPSMLIAGLGMVAAGMVFNIVQNWEVFIIVSELFILIPALLGLKGNLEMTLASRLSTQANIGNMDTARSTWRLCLANLALVQVQSGVVCVFASCIAVAMSLLSTGHVTDSHVLVLLSAACVTSFATALVLGGVTCALVVACHRFGVNPDNVAAPLAGSLGDVTTLAVLAVVASFLLSLSSYGLGLLGGIIGMTLLPIPACAYFAWRSEFTRDVLVHGWTPVLLSMIISSCGGFVLNRAVAAYDNMSIFSPLVNGIGGNLVAVHASRLSTFLHQQTKLQAEAPPEMLPKGSSSAPTLGMLASLQYKMLSLSSLKVLVALLPPAHFVFFTVIGLLKPHLQSGSTLPIPVPFFSFVFISSLLQVLTLLLASHYLVRYQWRSGRDPDSCTIPYLTALGDLLGTGVLALAFYCYSILFGGVAAMPTGSHALAGNLTAGLPPNVTLVA